MFPNIGLKKKKKKLNKPIWGRYGKKRKDMNDLSFNSNLSDPIKA